MAKAASVTWTRDHVLIAINLYCKIPFGKLHKNNPLIIDVARKMGRTSSSLAMKLCNFASLDPVQRARGVRGLGGGVTKLDRQIWGDFHRDSAVLGPESEQKLHDLFTTDDGREVDFLRRDRVRLEPSFILVPPDGPTESTATVRVRRGQQFFRQAILNAYGVRCCISGINVPRLLIASHIKPWRNFPSERVNPSNGLCLSALHDAAFDSGLVTLDEALRVVLSKRLKEFFPEPTLEVNFVPFAGKPIREPDMLARPDRGFLAYHRESIFTG